ncbi:MAG: CtsR family transcriptional regulator [Ndongobacter sp.]|nr:CtsR family transcriptional regulator [Ndongobacter sp.]
MAGLTSEIERFLLEMLADAQDGVLEIGRNDLAEHFNCAPSQINYVLTTRFTPYKGYYIESRRGGSGYIRIIRLRRHLEDTVEELLEEVVQDRVTCDKARTILQALEEQGAINRRECRLMQHAVDDNALREVPADQRNAVRAGVLKNMLLVFLR